MKPFLCKLGLHKIDYSQYLYVTIKLPGRKPYHKNFFYCKRCGKRKASFAIRKEKL